MLTCMTGAAEENGGHLEGHLLLSAIDFAANRVCCHMQRPALAQCVWPQQHLSYSPFAHTAGCRAWAW